MTSDEKPNETVGQDSDESSRGKCFVISPIGDPGTKTRKHADAVFGSVIEPASRRISLKAIRSDHMPEPGRITEQMFREILTADICIAVLTEANANVYYELAIAQCAARPVLLLIEEGQKPLFDIKDYRTITYEMYPDELDRCRQQLDEHLDSLRREGWTAPSLFKLYPFGPQLRDESEVRREIETFRTQPLPPSVAHRFALDDQSDREIVIVTGGIDRVLQELGQPIHVVVSSENTDFQLAQFYQDSLSGMLRYLDSRRTDGHIGDDHLGQRLADELKRLDYRLPVKAGAIVATPTTGLQSMGVHYVFHAATVQGKPGAGYEMALDNLMEMTRSIYARFGELAPNQSLETILFPVIGAGSAKGDPARSAQILMESVLAPMKVVEACKRTYLLAWKESHLEALRNCARKLGLAEVSS